MAECEICRRTVSADELRSVVEHGRRLSLCSQCRPRFAAARRVRLRTLLWSALVVTAVPSIPGLVSQKISLASFLIVVGVLVAGAVALVATGSRRS
jgi:hypothetical protein